jgi:putative protein-disulfide isomerase
VLEVDFIYVADPMCSWCWGFAPIIRALRERHPLAFHYRLVLGGLRAGPSAKPLAPMRTYLGEHWKEVERRTGQPFDHAFLERKDFVYDTGPACRAVVTARRLRPDRAFEFMHGLQEAFYARALDPTEMETFLQVADSTGVARDAFANDYSSDESGAETLADFRHAQEMGAHGFPSTFVRENSQLTIVARGWAPLGDFERALARWLD